MKKAKQYLKENLFSVTVFLIGICLFIAVRYFYMENKVKIIADSVLAVSFLLAFIGILYIIADNTNNKFSDRYSELCKKIFTVSRCVIILAVLGAVIRYFYILYTDWNVRQHDVGRIGVRDGHITYIYDMFINNLKLPEGNPVSRWQFYHPPLHHFIEAAFMKIVSGDNFDNELLQIPTLFYGCISMKIMYDFLVEMGIKGKALVYSFAMVCFNPTFIIMSGSINNDMLSTMFIYAIVLYTVKWHRNPDVQHIVPVALCFGFGMLSKLSVGLMAFPVALVFAVKLFQQIKLKKVKDIVIQYTVFLSVACPLGLFWTIRNGIKYNIAPNYVPMLDVEKNGWQYIGDRTWYERFEFSFSQLDNIFVEWTDYKTEYNPVVALMKTAVFGEFNLNKWNPELNLSVRILFYANLITAAISFAAMIYVFFSKKNGHSTVVKMFTGAVYLTYIINYFDFCKRYPFTCTMNIRYTAVIIMLGIFFAGQILSDLEKSKRKSAKIIRLFIVLSVYVLCTSSAFVYTALAV